MKRITALALALVLAMLALLPACAEDFMEPEPPISTLQLDKLSVSRLTNGKAKTTSLKGMGLSLSMGTAGGVPTLQGSFDNGKGQLLDLIFQVYGDRLLLSMGGISGTYYVDLEEVAEAPGEGARLAKGVGSGLALAGGHLDAVLQALSTEDGSGVRTLTLNLPEGAYNAVAKSMLDIMGGIDLMKLLDVGELEEELEASEDSPSLILRYDPKAATFELDIVRGGNGLRLKADMTVTVEPMTLVNISTDELMYDLLHMDAMRLMELRGELAIIALKYGHFAGGTGLAGILN